AQYRELASFSQFGSDLDKETKERLDHGLVLMEVIKQRQYSPVLVENQIMIFYAAVNNYLADIELDKIKTFEKGFFDFMGTQYPSVGENIKASGKLEEADEAQLKEAIVKYKEIFSKEYDALL
ncbi:MAG: F0F1 ATP synthase subunit alpha, partial [Clostridiales Family XIII bacterium]|nr:F0F1 ATP synthase subunit alpha [Clostridiales Family XIII bacterium]